LVEVVNPIHMTRSGDAEQLTVDGGKVFCQVVLPRRKSESDFPHLLFEEGVE
jgi:hypothetical protein